MAEKLAKEGVVIFTVGVGTPAGSEIQMVNEQGKTEYLRDTQGQIVHSRLDDPTLRAIARVTHGEYYPLGSLGEGLAKVRLALEDKNVASWLRSLPKIWSGKISCADCWRDTFTGPGITYRNPAKATRRKPGPAMRAFCRIHNYRKLLLAAFAVVRFDCIDSIRRVRSKSYSDCYCN